MMVSEPQMREYDADVPFVMPLLYFAFNYAYVHVSVYMCIWCAHKSAGACAGVGGIKFPWSWSYKL